MDKLKKMTSYRLFWPIVCLALVLLFNLIKSPSFFEISIKNGVLYGYLVDIFNRSSELIILAVGMTLCVAVYLLGSGETYAIPWIAAILIGLVVSVLCGMWNGFLVANMKIQPMVATLILFTAGRGMAQLITGGNNLYVKVDSFKYLGGFLPHIPVPTPILVAIIVVILATLFLNKTATKLYIESVGINPRASRLFGLNSTKIIFITYAACGLCAGIAGMIATSRITSIDANNVGNLMELDAILAVALGGNSLAGGKFSVAGSVIGAITIQALSTTLYAMKVTGDQLPLYKAIVVIIIVTLQSPEFKKYLNRIKAKRAAKTAGEKVA